MAGPPQLNLNLRKAELRRACRARRSAHWSRLGEEGREAAANVLGQIALDAIDFPKDAAIAGYWPQGSEIDPIALMRRLRTRGHILALPAIAADDRLVFRRWQPGDVLTPGAHGIPAPARDAPEIRPDAVLVPLVAFDRRGHRLGQGAGYYDRSLGQRRPACVIGVAFAVQEVDAVPFDARDQAMDAILTDQGVIRPSDLERT